MKQRSKYSTALIAAGIALLLCFSFSACGAKDQAGESGQSAASDQAGSQTEIQANENSENGGTQTEPHPIKDIGIQHETEFGGIVLMKSIDELNELGYTFGDSVNIEFSNGYSLEDLPYYNGYYTVPGDSLLVGYPGVENPKAAINYGDDLWELAEMSEDDTATISICENGKYLEIQEASDIHYEDDRDKYPSDEVFANFRVIEVGKLKKDILYRSASPCDNRHNRAPYVDDLIKKAGVRQILDLADDKDKIDGYMSEDDFDSPYFADLYKDGKVYPAALDMNYMSDSFRTKLITGLRSMVESKGPYLIHCTEGKDRTGFVCMILEALAGATYEEIVDDYMVTYDNYYGITKESSPDQYETIKENNIDAMIKYVAESGSSDTSGTRSNGDSNGSESSADAADPQANADSSASQSSGDSNGPESSADAADPQANAGSSGTETGADAADSSDLQSLDLAASAEKYLKAGGMSVDEIKALKASLMK